jgi:hypothetical protein
MDGLSSQFAVQLHFRYHNDGHIVIGGACSVSTAVFFNTSFLAFYGHILPFLSLYCVSILKNSSRHTGFSCHRNLSDSWQEIITYLDPESWSWKAKSIGFYESWFRNSATKIQLESYQTVCNLCLGTQQRYRSARESYVLSGCSS